MKYLKNRRAWLRWKRDAMGSQEGVTEPKQFPCFGYTSVRSFGYEEFQENYLYPEDVQVMVQKLASQAAPCVKDVKRPGSNLKACFCPQCCDVKLPGVA